MVFQPTNILNPQSAFSGCVLAVISGAVQLTLICCRPCLADGFPGRGNHQNWSAALPYYNLANKYMQSERYQDAIQKYHEAIGKYEYDPDFFINLGVALRKVEDFQAAEAAFKTAASLNEKDWMSWSNLANSYLKQDRLEDTIKAFETALKCNPPAAEKEAILKDIADIKKILSVKDSGAAPPAGSNPPSGKNALGNKLPDLVKQTAKEAPVGLVKQQAKEVPSGLQKQA
ncbi:MAG: tetratricopeptide repeat protein, partial [Candidatus Melainabacteria bacterium]|nr:tetratricopeptide repeat protein [Candidatus Melainabacteria bacterium]